MSKNNNGFFKKGMNSFVKMSVTLSDSNILSCCGCGDDVSFKLDPKSKDSVNEMRDYLHKHLWEKHPVKRRFQQRIHEFLAENFDDDALSKPEWVANAQKSAEEFKDSDSKVIKKAIRDLWILGYNDLEFLGRGGFGFILVDKKITRLLN